MITLKEYFEHLYKKSAKDYYNKLEKYLVSDEKKIIITANPETFMYAKKDKLIKNALLDPEIDTIPDGISIVKAAKHYKIKVEERITGCDTMIKLLELANKHHKKIYLFGAKEEVLKKLVDKIKKEYSNIKIVGSSNGYAKDKDNVFKDIIKKQPDLCFVALGIPEQEKLILRHSDRITKGLYMGVGGSFDVISGTKERAPQLFIKLNLEWLYRLIKEPKRIKRFYKNNIKFIIDVYKNR